MQECYTSCAWPFYVLIGFTVGIATAFLIKWLADNNDPDTGSEDEE